MLLNQGRRYIEKMIHGFKTIWKNFNCWHLNTQGESWYVVLYKNMIRRGPRVHEVWQSLRSHQSNVIAVKFVKACGCNPSLWCSSLDFGTWTRADVRLVVLYATRKSTMTHHSMLSACGYFTMACSWFSCLIVDGGDNQSDLTPVCLLACTSEPHGICICWRRWSTSRCSFMSWETPGNWRNPLSSDRGDIWA